MDPGRLVEQLCRLPADFYDGSKSMAQLVAESGIAIHPEIVTTSSVSAYLRDYPAIIDPWLKWSANKRVLSGWYFLQRSGRYVVGFHPIGEVLSFSQPELACAEFVVREVNALIAIGGANRPET
jgi:hypothetical protein